MTKRILKIAVASAIIIALLASASCAEVILLNPADRQRNGGKSVFDSEVRGVWIASVMNINYPSSPDLGKEQLKAELDDIIENVKKASLNTIFFQVRPSSDALYRSEIFPVSKYISTDGTLRFDPLEYLVKEAHRNGISVEAWVNPLRVTAEKMNDRETALASLDEKCPAKLSENLSVFYDDGKLYYDPGLPEVKKLVCDGAYEIVKNYGVDGIVIDDYFYPYPVYDASGARIAEFDDAKTFAEYGGGFDDIGDWRRNNINKIVEGIYHAVKSADPKCKFGVSPYGIWQNSDGKNGGSETSGLEAYSAIYCDALAWIDGGYIDYIAPQIAWRFSDSTSPYPTLVRWWSRAVSGTEVELLISHVPYKYEGSLWSDPQGEMKLQVEFARGEPSYCGSIFYGYDALKNNANSVTDELRAVFSSQIVYSHHTE